MSSTWQKVRPLNIRDGRSANREDTDKSRKVLIKQFVSGKERRDMSKILLVDDEKRIRTFYAEVLSDEGFEVITTGSCHQALKLIDAEHPSAVILDIRMDDCDGLDLLQKIRLAHPNVPIILNTAYDSYREDVKAVAADEYVLKSHDLSELTTKLAEVLEEKG
jgi:DNA-binding NtrC family response regulator